MLGGWSYEVLDTKLARRAKGEALLQLLLYSDLLTLAQGVEPELMHLALGGAGSENPASFRVAEYAAYSRAVRQRFEAHAASPADTYPEPVEHCGVCEWQQDCVARRRRPWFPAGYASVRRFVVERVVEAFKESGDVLGVQRSSAGHLPFSQSRSRLSMLTPCRRNAPGCHAESLWVSGLVRFTAVSRNRSGSFTQLGGS